EIAARPPREAAQYGPTPDNPQVRCRIRIARYAAGTSPSPRRLAAALAYAWQRHGAPIIDGQPAAVGHGQEQRFQPPDHHIPVQAFRGGPRSGAKRAQGGMVDAAFGRQAREGLGVAELG